MNRVLGPLAALLILVPGLYMMQAQWGWTGWVVTGLVSWVFIAVLGAYTGIRVMRGRMDRRSAVISWLVRVGIALGVVFDMSVKPNALVSVVAVVVGIALGAAAGVVARRRAVPA